MAQSDTARTEIQRAAIRPEVARYLEFFQGPARDRMRQWLERGTSYRGAIRQRLAREGLPSEFEFLPLIESGYSNTATSRAGAVGMWQFVPETAREYGLRVDRLVDERRDPARASDAAIRHIGDLKRTFGSSLLAAAAYNGGAGRIRRGLEQLGRLRESDSLGGGDFFELANRGLLAPETREYVPQLVAAAIIGRDPSRFGFAAGLGRETAASIRDSVRVDRPIRLDQAARALGVAERRLQELNPELVRGILPPGDRWLKVPVGLSDSVLGRLPTLPRVSPLELSAIVARRATLGRLIWVHRGDSLADLAARYGVDAESLRRTNALPKSYPLRPGQALRLPSP